MLDTADAYSGGAVGVAAAVPALPRLGAKRQRPVIINTRVAAAQLQRGVQFPVRSAGVGPLRGQR